jgi:hypothetical protein
MKKTFVETAEFTEWVKEHLSDDALSELQRELLNAPDTGSVMPGCGGLRKMRVADPRRGQGKRGGARVIYCTWRSSTRSTSSPSTGRTRRMTFRSPTRSFTVNSSGSSRIGPGEPERCERE